ncbi:hypothetical protein RF11_09898 [Thelohanellus kitauei]|uniref:Serpin domain-containing protein n=1 Tax=Thelohanellus kitauei TaxID=669202 RepID=A0A0C2N225_THEKT|nr:hypothetical protein RF11_09898 [Thelohanellus kitauei]
MSSEVVNTFTFKVLTRLYTLQNYTDNVGFSGSVLYVVMAAINIGLRGRSYNQLSTLLHEDFEKLYEKKTLKKSETARKWTSFSDKSKHLLNARQYFYYHGELYPHYEKY